MERSWGVVREGGRDPIIPVDTMTPGFITRSTISSALFKVGTTLMLGI